MIDIDELERLAKDAAETGVAGHRIKFFMSIDPESILALIAEVRALREDAERYRWLCNGNGYFLEEEQLYGHVNQKSEADEAIDAARKEKS
jgi:hypothetical protein